MTPPLANAAGSGSLPAPPQLSGAAMSDTPASIAVALTLLNPSMTYPAVLISSTATVETAPECVPIKVLLVRLVLVVSTLAVTAQTPVKSTARNVTVAGYDVFIGVRAAKR